MIVYTEVVISVCSRLSMPVLVLYGSKISDVGVLIYINGGILGVILCWILPILSYRNICMTDLGYISSVEFYFMYSVLVLGVLVVIITIIFGLFVGASGEEIVQ